MEHKTGHKGTEACGAPWDETCDVLVVGSGTGPASYTSSRTPKDGSEARRFAPATAIPTRARVL